MTHLRPEPSSSWQYSQCTPPPRINNRFTGKRCVCDSALFLLLFTQVLSSWFTAPRALAATKPPVASGHLTLSQFLAEQPHAHLSTQPFHFPTPSPTMTVFKQEHLPNYAHAPASAELPTMQPLVIALSSAYVTGIAPSSSPSLPLSGTPSTQGHVPPIGSSTPTSTATPAAMPRPSAPLTTPTSTPTRAATPTPSVPPVAAGTPAPTTGKPLDINSSDKRLQFQIQPGSFDLSPATTAQGQPLGPVTSLTLTCAKCMAISQGRSMCWVNIRCR